MKRLDFFRLAGAAAAIVGMTLLFRGLAYHPGVAPDFSDEKPGAETIVVISTAESGSAIGAKLEAAGVVKSSQAFFRRAVLDPRSSRIAPGEHRIQTRISAKLALQQLLDAKRLVNAIEVKDGAWVSEVAANLIAAGFSRGEVESALKNLSLPIDFNAKKAEGFLYPAFYDYQKGETASEIVKRMIARFESATSDIQWKGVKGFTPYQILTIASLIQAEGTPDVQRKVARVIFNRLQKRMPLQMDTTVHYIFKRRGKIALSLADTKVSSPYNTFLNAGLPPTPINNPTVAAINAALNAESGDWLYFVTVSPNVTKFTSSYDEFLTFKAEYKKNLAVGAFK